MRFMIWVRRSQSRMRRTLRLDTRNIWASESCGCVGCFRPL
jgi:hypothetical protein